MSYANMKPSLIFGLLFSFLQLVCCSNVSRQTNSESLARQSQENSNILTMPTNISKNEIKIDEIRLFAWWWKESDAQAGINTKNPPPKEYREIYNWEYDGEGITTSPHEVDIITQLENGLPSAFTGKIIFKVAMRFDEDKSSDQLWLNENSIHSESFTISAGERQTFKVSNYDLTAALNTKLKEAGLSKLRFNVSILDEHGKEISSQNKILNIALGD